MKYCQVRHQARLADEVLLELGDGRVLLPDQLDRHRLPELPGAQLVGLVDDPHAALREHADHLVVDLVENMGDRGQSGPRETTALTACK